jgi:DNA polymerase III alpha subunit
MLANGKRVRRFNDQQCFKTQAEMQALFADMRRFAKFRRNCQTLQFDAGTR